ncbi:LacI family DNA-binding transcriptional regulator [Variovorax paradoxus]|uniref:Transcriptional regulator, LacI family n=1 Tax=Variovorax paradoxus (strain EPS) TaxID=595537 RepID=E6V8Z3_VARPE|nr:LacI family DNA-binding transcriptional regulator [Variovorax paradoxus]ADU37316.1 transcriptional regulator, LacI family [Variovorax paradoxus EPS]
MSRITDVARRAGVSTSTVSNVLNGRSERMAAETLARVEAAIRDLKYRPNTSARQLKTGHTPLLGVLVPSMANPMYGFIAREIEAMAQGRYGFRIMIGNTYRDAEKEKHFFEDLMAHGVRGVIIISSMVDEQHVEAAAERGLVAVSYDRRATPGVPSVIDHVTVDNFESLRIATSHLIEQGHRRLAFVTPSGRTMSRNEKIRGFLAAAKSAGLEGSAQVVESLPVDEYGDSMMSELGRMQARLLAKSPDRPTGVIGVNDLLAFGLMAGFRDEGLSVPEDVSVMGIDNVFLSTLMYPAMTSVRVPVPEMAQVMVERVMSRLADASLPTQEFVFAPTLVARDSVVPPRA